MSEQGSQKGSALNHLTVTVWYHHGQMDNSAHACEESIHPLFLHQGLIDYFLLIFLFFGDWKLVPHSLCLGRATTIPCPWLFITWQNLTETLPCTSIWLRFCFYFALELQISPPRSACSQIPYWEHLKHSLQPGKKVRKKSSEWGWSVGTSETQALPGK